MNYFLNDHKVGYVLSRKLADEINGLLGDVIRTRTFYKLWNVNDPADRYVCFIRHPYEIISSAYMFHKICKEAWAAKIGVKYYDWYLSNFPMELSPDEEDLVQSALFSAGDQTYQERLKSMDTEDGLKYEMEHVSRLTIEGIYEFKYLRSPNVLVVRFEDLLENYTETMMSMLDFLGLSDPDGVLLMRLKRHDVHNLDVKAMEHVTNKKLDPNRYKTLFTSSTYSHFNRIFPRDTLEKLGYKHAE